MTLLVSRSIQWVPVTAVAMWVLAAAIGRRALEVDLSATFPPTKLVAVELCAVVTATLLAILTRPGSGSGTASRVAPASRGWRGPGVGHHAVRAVRAAVAPWLPAGASWTWVSANALVLSATVLLLAPLLTPLLAGVVTVVLWFGGAVVTNLAPGVWQPLADYRDQHGHWVVAAVLVVAAVAVHAGTCGMTAWAHRQFSQR
jgi:hypothetical protein